MKGNLPLRLKGRSESREEKFKPHGEEPSFEIQTGNGNRRKTYARQREEISSAC
jgi:hypothetical protein